MSGVIKYNQLLECAKANLNVLLEGSHGIGKTAMIKQVCKDLSIPSLVFSGATLEPWVDIIGIPGQSEKDENGMRFIDLIRPGWVARKDIQLIFIDELNRAATPVRNAVMQLIQDKEINGYKFENLKSVWAAINPSGGDYDVEDLDPAIVDRFHIQATVSTEPSRPYFTAKFGKSLGNKLVEWYKNEMRKSGDKFNLTPRRLDYAAEIFRSSAIDPSLVFPKGVHTPSFVALFESEGNIREELLKQIQVIRKNPKNNSSKKLSQILSTSEEISECEDIIIGNFDLCVTMVPVEITTGWIAQNQLKLEHFIPLMDSNISIAARIRSIIHSVEGMLDKNSYNKMVKAYEKHFNTSLS